MLAETPGLTISCRKLHTMDKTIQDFEDRLWDMYDDSGYSIYKRQADTKQ